jgi:hypothetical protein
MRASAGCKRGAASSMSVLEEEEGSELAEIREGSCADQPLHLTVGLPMTDCMRAVRQFCQPRLQSGLA